MNAAGVEKQVQTVQYLCAQKEAALAEAHAERNTLRTSLQSAETQLTMQLAKHAAAAAMSNVVKHCSMQDQGSAESKLKDVMHTNAQLEADMTLMTTQLTEKQRILYESTHMMYLAFRR
jgi:hypothetical protein